MSGLGGCSPAEKPETGGRGMGRDGQKTGTQPPWGDRRGGSAKWVNSPKGELGWLLWIKPLPHLPKALSSQAESKRTYRNPPGQLPPPPLTGVLGQHGESTVGLDVTESGPRPHMSWDCLPSDPPLAFPCSALRAGGLNAGGLSQAPRSAGFQLHLANTEIWRAWGREKLH